MRRTVMLLMAFSLWGCAPEVGSPAWCEAMDDKPKGDWTANEMADYTRNCIFRKSAD